ncbi:hypothetical protein M404DRAFT_153038 [Pisolithus tinctorius Marx 270]|uniref:DUF8040 domain-containing protein n=1 Tax=Pisolithus tinctorius Marx 270 TaxID=870435 RepID=A0A0C3ITQ1_PISTI|nr:hypothetical protein M404DRAFT_153038 [Pisolithus tinctorius Marx 270]
MGHGNSRFVSLEEQLAIFLYTSITGLSIRHVGEHFQRSNDTISRYFCKFVFIFSSSPFYDAYVHMPAVDEVQSGIREDPRFWPFFQDAIGVTLRSHVSLLTLYVPVRARSRL